MARLKVRLRSRVISEIPLEEGRNYIGGRKESCDIFLQNEKGISREHFQLSFQNGQWALQGLSRFGEIVVGGDRVESLALEHGVIFSVPPYDFEFLLTSADSPNPVGPAGPLAVVDRQGFKPAPVVEEIDVYEKTVVGVAPSAPYIKIMDGNGEPRELIRLDGGDTWVAGRDSNSPIHIRDQRVSRRQFEIRKNGLQFEIIDLGSVNGTLVNGTPISSSDATVLKSGDAISVLENYLYFELHDPNFKSRLEMVNLQVPVDSAALAPVGVGHQQPVLVQQHSLPAASFPSYQYPPAEEAKAKFDWKKRRPLIIAAAAVFLLFLFLMSGGDNSSPKSQIASSDPYGKLTTEQQKLVRDTYQLAKVYFQQGKYELARGELVKMTEFVPEFEDSRSLGKLIEEAQYVQEQQRKQDELEKSRREQEEKIQYKVAECQKLLGPEITRDKIESCLFEVIHFNPTHPLFAQIYAQVDQIVADRQARAARSAAYQSDVAKLKGMWSKAEGLSSSDPLAAIALYKKITTSALPDPSGVKGLAAKKMSALQKTVNAKTITLQDQATALANSNDYRGAIFALRAAQKIDPSNPLLQEKIDENIKKLRELMMVVYQEGILEENFGNIEGGENKEGAKQKWQDILKRDIPEGEYYKKAVIKLKKYGAI